MKWNLFRSLTVFCCVLALMTSAHTVADAATNTWRSSGLDSLIVYALVINPDATDTIYAATSGGVYKSTNGGGSWVDTGLYDVRCLAIDPVDTDIIYAGTGDGDVYKSEDGGSSWGEAILETSAINALAIDPDNSSILYAGSTVNGVYKSVNGGGVWTNPLSLIPTNVNTLAIDPDSNIVYAGHTGGLYKTTDGGLSWEPDSDLDLIPVRVITINPLTHTTLYAGTSANGVFKSTTGASSWFSSDMGTLTVNALAINPDVTSILYSGTNGSGVYRSTTSGTGWVAFNTGLGALNVYALAIDPDDPDTVYAGTNDGVFKITVTGIDTESDDSSDCFIATAAFGSPMEPQVRFLREFRDRFLMSNRAGRAFVDLYYQFSPPLARFIAGHEEMRLLVRWALLPVVGLSYLALNLGLVVAVALSVLFLTGAFVLVRSGRRRAFRNKVP
jgi:photosystem II stability/assembly factor-like uncharacterized protein